MVSRLDFPIHEYDLIIFIWENCILERKKNKKADMMNEGLFMWMQCVFHFSLLDDN